MHNFMIADEKTPDKRSEIQLDFFPSLGQTIHVSSKVSATVTKVVGPTAADLRTPGVSNFCLLCKFASKD